MADAIRELQESVEYEMWKPSLQAVVGVWKKLTNLESWARRDPKVYFPRYKQFLDKAIAQCKADAVSNDEVKQLTDEYFEHTVKMRDARVIELEELRGGQYWATWCEKWCPTQYKSYSEALTDVCEHPSKATFRRLVEAHDDCLKAFISAS